MARASWPCINLNGKTAEQLQGRFVKQTKLAELRLHGNVSKFGCERPAVGDVWIRREAVQLEKKIDPMLIPLSISFDDMTVVMAASPSRLLKSAGNGFFR